MSGRQILLLALSAVIAATLVDRLYKQLRPIPLFVGSIEQLPPDLAADLASLEVEPTMLREQPYETAAQHPLDTQDLLGVRALLVWRFAVPPPVDHLTVFSSTRVVASVIDGKSWGEIEFQRGSSGWRIAGQTGPFFNGS